jgi:hypothetical protein
MAYTSPAEINASAGLPNLFNYINDVTGNWFINMLIISIFSIILISYTRSSNNDIVTGFGVAGFSTFIISTMLYLGQALSGTIYAITIAVAIIGALGIFLKK